MTVRMITAETLSIEVGAKVVFTVDVECYPFFVIPKGTTGTVVEADPDAKWSCTMFSVKVDGEIEGLTDEESKSENEDVRSWDNCLIYVPEDFECDGYKLPFKKVEGGA